MFSKILIANRGEIAVRIIRSLKKMNIHPVLIYHEDESDAPYLKLTKEKYSLGRGSLADTFLNTDKIISIALKSGAEAIHPGYGFLSEDPVFAGQCKKNNLTFIGPAADAIRLMGNKTEAIQFVSGLDIPTIPRITGSINTILEKVEDTFFPAMIKAVAGGGGKGMRLVEDRILLHEKIEQSAREALNYFGDHDIYLEKYIAHCRHIEVQILADNYGKVMHLFERECSLQRRHQKVIEEAPVFGLKQQTLKKLRDYAIKISQSVEYSGAGTVEFLVDEDENIYFLEMNTRIQVEHGVTEEITGIDLVSEQVKIASGSELELDQEDISINGHAVEVRIYAEDPMNDFSPSPGKILNFKVPEDIRIDHDLENNFEILPVFDPLLAKMISHESDRHLAFDKLYQALEGTTILGIRTNIGSLCALIKNPAVISGNYTTTYLERNLEEIVDAARLLSVPKDLNPYLVAGILVSLTSENIEDNLLHKNNPFTSLGRWRLINRFSVSFNHTDYIVQIKESSQQLVIRINNADLNIRTYKLEGSFVRFELNGINYEIPYCRPGHIGEITLGSGPLDLLIKRSDILNPEEINTLRDKKQGSNGKITAPLNGRIISLQCEVGDEIEKDQILLIIESMKMENRILADFQGKITEIAVELNQQISAGDLLIYIEPI